MTDRELLELAAKAAGNDVEFHGEMPWFASGKRPWNPLTNDSDALRLAVELEIDIAFTNTHSPQVHARAAYKVACIEYEVACIEYKVACIEDRELGTYAATRRAIVRAAAEIGRGME